MQIELFKGGFAETFQQGDIAQIMFFYGGTCEIRYQDGSAAVLSVPTSPYNSQYGVPVSSDGSMLFVADWDAGVSTYAVMSGRKIWSVSEKRIRNIDVFNGYIVMVKYNAALLKADELTGKQITQLKGRFSHSFRIDDSHLLLETNSGTLCLVNTDELTIVKRYLQRVCNPEKFLSWCIQGAFVKDGKLSIYGFEQYPQGDYSNPEKHDFERVIDSGVYANKIGEKDAAGR